jgi:hypothetical protein
MELLSGIRKMGDAIVCGVELKNIGISADALDSTPDIETCAFVSARACLVRAEASFSAAIAVPTSGLCFKAIRTASRTLSAPLTFGRPGVLGA